MSGNGECFGESFGNRLKPSRTTSTSCSCPTKIRSASASVLTLLEPALFCGLRVAQATTVCPSSRDRRYRQPIASSSPPGSARRRCAFIDEQSSSVQQSNRTSNLPVSDANRECFLGPHPLQP